MTALPQGELARALPGGGLYMHMDDMVWKDEYGIGVEQIDRAHQEFFRIARRIFLANGGRSPNSWAVMEGVKFLKAYVARHFQEEEAFMASIRYKDLALHKAQHDLLKNKVVPRVESYLQKHGQSAEAINKFLDILVLWITRHILVHDKAIGWEIPENIQK